MLSLKTDESQAGKWHRMEKLMENHLIKHPTGYPMKIRHLMAYYLQKNIMHNYIIENQFSFCKKIREEEILAI